MSQVVKPSDPQSIPVEQLIFDPENPRLPKRVDSADEDAVLAWMLDDATLIELMGSIAEQGYFAGEPLLAIRSPHENDTYIVIEGNRRLAATKLLLHPERAKTKRSAVQQVAQNFKVQPPTHLPVIVYPSRDDIIEYLGYRHITGIKEWEPLAKARYLHSLDQRRQDLPEQERYRELAKLIGTRARYVSQLLAALALYERMEEAEFFGIEGVSEPDIEFSLITTALGYKNIVEFLGLENGLDTELKGLDLRNLRYLTMWMFKKENNRTRLGESRNLRDLSAVVHNPIALKAFTETAITLEDSALLTDRPIEIYRNAIDQAKDKLEIANRYVRYVEEPQESDIEGIKELDRILRVIQNHINTLLAKN